MGTYAQQLFDTITLETLNEFIRDNQEEHLHLDFKLSAARMTKDDRRNLAKALSGFANGDGGVIIWGVDAAPNAEGIDCARAKQPISPLSQFMSQLAEFTGAAANPTVDGVVHRRIADGVDRGYALTLVPSSDSGPHMAKLGEDRYYKRSGGRFAKMEHFDLEDMFGRRQRPALDFNTRIISSNRDANAAYHLYMVLSVTNTGRGVARAPYLRVHAPASYTINTHGLSSGRADYILLRIRPADEPNTYHFIGIADCVIYPGVTFDVLRIVARFAPDQEAFEDLVITCDFAAENLRLSHVTLTVPVKELLKAANCPYPIHPET